MAGNMCEAAPQTRGRPFLRWAGSKRKQIGRLKEYWSEGYDRYVEPFAGSACLFFALRPKRALLGDNNKELINVYRQLRKNSDEIFNRLVHIPRERDAYLRWRSKDVAKLDPVTRALRFIYLNHNCFNGIYRTNSAGQFNVPFGSKLSRYLTRAEFLDCAKALARTSFSAADFQTTLSEVRKGDFVYLDPPYALSTRRMFREYGEEAFAVDDVGRLSEELCRIDKIGAKFVVSYADCPESRKLAKDWDAKKFLVRRHIAGFTDNRSSAFEWLISN
jgi:DNA adenine methylase